MMERAGGGLYGIAADRNTAVFGNDDGVDPGALTCAGYGAEVADVGHTVEEHDERQYPRLVKLGDKVVETVVGYGRHHREDTLMVLACDAVDALDRDALHHHPVGPRLRDEFRSKVALQVLGNEYLVYFLSGVDSLNDGAESVDIIVSFHSFIF